METVTVEELIRLLKEYPCDMKVYYSTEYALVPFTVRMADKYLILEMTSEVKELLS